MKRFIRAAIVASSWLVTGCAMVQNYPADGPRYAGGTIRNPPASLHMSRDSTPAKLRVVTFNIAFALEIDSAVAVLRDSALAGADIVLLQEMDASGTERIAGALGMQYVYYPATRHPQSGRDFGNAILSRWPIIDDRRIVLPHDALIGWTRRTATAATIQTGTLLLRVYSAHLGTVVNITPAQRRSQLRAIITDADSFEHVIIGGDMNDPVVGTVAREAGYLWPTRRGPWTASAARLDHIFLKGLAPATMDGTGTVLNNRGASDHRAVWLDVLLR